MLSLVNTGVIRSLGPDGRVATEVATANLNTMDTTGDIRLAGCGDDMLDGRVAIDALLGGAARMY